jgi:TonB family protein
VHYAFVGEYLRSLDTLPADDPLNSQTLRVDVGIVAIQATGEIAELYLRRSSGNAEFDAAALSAFLRVNPVPVPAEVASADGRAYFTWQLYRRQSAADSMTAKPYRFIDD